MDSLEISFLGTSGSIPTEKRNHSGILVSYGAEKILIDCGEGTQRQLRIAGINLCKITKILITHWHADHTLGLSGILNTLGTLGYSKTLKIYGPRGTKEKISLLEKLYGKFRIKVETKEVSKIVCDEKDLQILSEKMSHGITTLAYSLIVKEKIRINKNKLKKLKVPNSPKLAKLLKGKDITLGNKKIRAKEITYKERPIKITIILDTKYNEKSILFAKNSDILICESSFSIEEKEKAKEYNHLTSQEAAQIARKSKSKKLILTHLSQRYDKNPEKIEQEAKKIFRNTSVAKDFDEIVINQP